MSTEALVAAMTPLPVAALGWFCVGYHVNDAPGRVQGILQLLRYSGQVPEDTALETVRRVLRNLLQLDPRILTLDPQPQAQLLMAPSCKLQPCACEWLGYCGPTMCLCGGPLHRWKQEEAVFFTFTRGLVAGQVLFLRCFPCSAVYSPALR